MSFSVGICLKDTLEEEVRIDDDDLIRPDGFNDRFVVDFSEQQRAKLTKAEYTGYVYEVRADGRRDPRGWFSYTILTKPANYIPNQPVEPAALQLDYNTQSTAYVLLPIYVLSNPSFTSKATAHAAPGQGIFITINGLPYFKTAAGVCLIPVGPPETQ
ncbi:hypothetical protein A6C57_01210 [Fibrella sp. ES10-3-2-2]